MQSILNYILKLLLLALSEINRKQHNFLYRAVCLDFAQQSCSLVAYIEDRNS